MKIKMLVAALVTCALFAAAYAQAPFDKAKLDQFFDRLAEKNKAMGSVVIAKDGNVLYARSIGYARIDASEKKPLSSASRYRIASITKMFTATMILQLIEQGKLKPADTIDKFVPQLPNSQKITIQQILLHRSGIPNVRRDQSQPNINTIPMTKDEMLALIVKTPPEFEPDTKYAYSNSGYFILGLIIEKVTGKSYGEVLEERICSKIGLKDTYVATGNIDVSKNESLTYVRSGGEWKTMPETHPSILFGGGSIISSPNDMAKFIHALFDLKLVSQQTLNQMKTMRDGEGMGMGTFTFAGKIFYGHTGGGDNYGAWLAYLPEEKLAVAYTTNAKLYPVENIVRGVIDIYYNRPFQIPSFESVVVSADVLDKYVGVYSSPEAQVKFTISRKGGTLYVQPGNQSAAPLQATAEDKFMIENGAASFEFDAAKKQMIVRRTGAGQRVFTKEN